MRSLEGLGSFAARYLAVTYAPIFHQVDMPYPSQTLATFLSHELTHNPTAILAIVVGVGPLSVFTL